MTIFFCSVGFTACFRLLKKGGIQVFMFLGLAIAICIVQDAVGSGLAAAFGLDPLLGLCMGSMPLSALPLLLSRQLHTDLYPEA